MEIACKFKHFGLWVFVLTMFLFVVAEVIFVGIAEGLFFGFIFVILLSLIQKTVFFFEKMVSFRNELDNKNEHVNKMVVYGVYLSFVAIFLLCMMSPELEDFPVPYFAVLLLFVFPIIVFGIGWLIKRIFDFKRDITFLIAD